MLEANNMWNDRIVEALVVAVGDGYGDAFVFIVDFDENFWRFEIFNLFLYQWLRRLLHQLRNELLAGIRSLFFLEGLFVSGTSALLLLWLGTAVALSWALWR